MLRERLGEAIYRLLVITTDEPLIVNLGNPDEVTVRDLAEEVLMVTESASEIIYHPLPEDDPRVRRPDIRLARQILGWSPVVRRWDGLMIVVPYFQKAVRELEPVRSQVPASLGIKG